MDIVFFGQQNWDVCWTAKQHLATRLAQRGHRVLYVNPSRTRLAASVSAAASCLWPVATQDELHQFAPNLHIFTANECARLGKRWCGRREKIALRHQLKRMGMVAPLALVSTPRQRWLKDAIRPYAMVYYAVDEWTGFDYGEAHKARLRAHEEVLLAQSDLALAVSPRLVERFKKIQPRSYLQENGVDEQFFAPDHVAHIRPHLALANLPRPRLGFVGQVDRRLDQDLLVHVARSRPKCHIVLVGRVLEGVDVSALEREQNIHFLGYQPYEELPRVMRDFDVCLVPYVDSQLTQSCNPLKVYEYLASGAPVVATDLQGLNACREVIHVASSREAFLKAVDTALADPGAGLEKRRAMVSRNTWDKRTDLLEQRLDEACYLAGARHTRPRPTLSTRRLRDEDLCLDAKDEDQRQLSGGFNHAGVRIKRRAILAGVSSAGFLYYLARVGVRAMLRKRHPRMRRILVARRGALGDALALAPALKALRRTYPEATIDLAVRPNSGGAAVLKTIGHVDNLLHIPKMHTLGPAEKLSLAWRFFRRGYDAVLTGSYYFLIPEAMFAGAPVSIGVYEGHPVQRMNRRAIPVGATVHEADSNLALAEALGAFVPLSERPPALDGAAMASEEDLALALGNLGVPGGAEWFAVHAGAARETRRWAPERFAALIARLLRKHPELRCLLTGVVKEHRLVAQVKRLVPSDVRERVHNTCGFTNFPLLNALIERSRLVISNDTGVMHLARARRRPLLALLGPEEDRRWGPYPLSTGEAIAIRHIVPCAPCGRKHCNEHYCMRLLTVDAAAEAAERLLASAGDRAPKELRPLEQVKHRYNWRHLEAHGFQVPRVTVALVVRKASTRSDLRDALSALRRAEYPNVEPMIVGTPGADNGTVPPEAVHAVAKDGSRESICRAIAQNASGAFCVFFESPSLERLRVIGDAVATLQRTPLAMGVVGGKARTLEGLLASGDSWPEGVMMRRDAMESLYASDDTRQLQIPRSDEHAKASG